MKTTAIQTLMGAEGIKEAYRMTLSAQNADIVCVSEKYEQVIGDYFTSEYAPKLYKTCQTREILPDVPENREYAASKDASRNAVRFMNAEKAGETDKIIIEDMVIYISFNLKAPYALVITDADLAKTERALFEEVWKNAGK
jgi:hypothetical protein